MLKLYSMTILALILLSPPLFSADSDSESKDRIKYLGDLIIEAGEVVEGDAVVLQGDLIVKGLIQGDAIVSLGNAYVDSGGRVLGDLVAMKGKIFVDTAGVVEGKVVEQNLFDSAFGKRHRHEFIFKAGEKTQKGECEENGEGGPGPRLGYNKVDGFFLGFGTPKIVHNIPWIALHGFVGYGFANDRLQFSAEMDKFLFRNQITEIGIEAHKITATEDDWIIENLENTLAAFFLHEDFRDYFYRTGVQTHFRQKLCSSLSLKLTYVNDEYNRTTNHTNWALFGGDKDFRPNFGFLGPTENVREGFMHSLIAEGSLNLHQDDLSLSASAEFADYGLGGDFEFARYILEMHSRLKISEFERMILRFKLGSSQDTLPPQKVFTLGGISTLRGYKFKEFYGDQMALLNMEYWISGDRHSHLFWPLKFMQFGLFADFGSTHNLIFSDFDPQYYKMDVGFSFMDKDEDLRLDLARRTDSGDKPWVVTFRIAQFL